MKTIKQTISAIFFISIIFGHALVSGATASTGISAERPRRFILISWDGTRRDSLQRALSVSDPSKPCWEGGDIYPVPVGSTGEFTCMPTMRGAGIPAFEEDQSGPVFGAFQVIASHTTNDGKTFTKPQHASMLTGYNVTDHGVYGNVSRESVPEHSLIPERLMDTYDPIGPNGRRQGGIFNTLVIGSTKFVRSFCKPAKRNGGITRSYGRGKESRKREGALKKFRRVLKRWNDKAIEGEGPEDFFVFLHFKAADWAGHLNGSNSRQYQEALSLQDWRLYGVMKELHKYGWDDAAILITTDHGFSLTNRQHARGAGTPVIDTWMAAYNFTLNTSGIPIRTGEDYCSSQANPEECNPDSMPSLGGPVPNVFVTFVAPTVYDHYRVDWRSDPLLKGRSLYTSP